MLKDVAHEKERQMARLQQRLGKRRPSPAGDAKWGGGDGGDGGGGGGGATPRAASPTGRRNRSGLSASKALGYS